MPIVNITTPGVYINEVNAFPNSVVPVATSVPAFIGYTPQAEYDGKSFLNKAQKVTSFAEFLAIFSFPNPPVPANPVQQYSPQYYVVEEDSQSPPNSSFEISGKHYSVRPDPDTIYYLYNSIRLFYENGGGDAYIVSVGSYGEASSRPQADLNKPIVNSNISLGELQHGLALLKKEAEPTLYICPEATLLSVNDNATLMQSILLQASEMQTAMCIFDIIGGHNPDLESYKEDIATFRNNTGETGLSYGASYYPFINTTILQSSDLDYTNLFGGDIQSLEKLLNPPTAPNPSAETILNNIQNPTENPLSNSQNHNALMVTSRTYLEINKHMLEHANVLPPSGGMAGVYTLVDNTEGVWKSPANVSMTSVSSLTFDITNEMQEGLNVDVSGKSINAIRMFPGRGILVWGARTLDSNSLDWRYISVRRTITMLEQSCKLAAMTYVFEANDASTWGGIKSMISSFLTDIWRQGGLAGSSANDAFTVNVGLGSTMTSVDILNGILRIEIKVAVTRPAEFIVISFEQEMAAG